MNTIEPGRLRRALHLEVSPALPDHWTVTGGRLRHLVTEEGGETTCTCIDHVLYPERTCKHQLAVRLEALPEEIRAALRELVPAEVPRARRSRAA